MYVPSLHSHREVQCQFSNLASSDVELGFIITSFLDSGGTTTAQIRKALNDHCDQIVT